MDCIYMMQSKQDICVEPLERCGDGKNMEKKEKKLFQCFSALLQKFCVPLRNFTFTCKTSNFWTEVQISNWYALQKKSVVNVFQTIFDTVSINKKLN